MTTNETIRQEIEENFDVFLHSRLLDVALKIKEKMLEKKLRISDLAQRLNVTDANVSRWLRGDQNLSLKTLFLLADCLEEPLSVQLGSATLCIDALDAVEGAASEIEASSERDLQTPWKLYGRGKEAVSIDKSQYASYGRIAASVDSVEMKSTEQVKRYK